MIGELGRGVVVVIREPFPVRLSQPAEPEADHEDSEGLRDYGVAAQILLDLGVRDMILLHNTHWTIVGLDGYGLRVVDQRPISDEARRAWMAGSDG